MATESGFQQVGIAAGDLAWLVKIK